MRRILFTCALVLSACGDNLRTDRDDAGPGSDGGQPVDGGVDTLPDGAHEITGCVDRPDAVILRPPSSGLPCDLVPPGLTVTVTP